MNDKKKVAYIEIVVPVIKESEKKLCFHEDLLEISYGELKYKVQSRILDRSLIIISPDGDRFLIETGEILQEFCKKHAELVESKPIWVEPKVPFNEYKEPGGEVYP